MAYGLPIVTTRWRSLSEMFTFDYAGLVGIKSPDKIAAAMLNLVGNETGEDLRKLFLARYTVEAHLAKLAEAIASSETAEPALRASIDAAS
jgi:glycosyltransferase involved in cell wall biosynthesis